jgi:hypothetical protein
MNVMFKMNILNLPTFINVTFIKIIYIFQVWWKNVIHGYFIFNADLNF